MPRTDFVFTNPQLLVRHLKKEEIEGLRQMFLDMDADSSGTITLEELKTGLDRHGAHMAKSEVEALMATVDVQGDGTLDYEEFLAATVHMSKLQSEENLLKAFSDIDADGSGFITANELAAKLVELGMKETPDEIIKMIQEADLNHDGKIDYSEFVNLMAPELLGTKEAPKDAAALEKQRSKLRKARGHMAVCVWGQGGGHCRACVQVGTWVLDAYE